MFRTVTGVFICFVTCSRITFLSGTGLAWVSLRGTVLSLQCPPEFHSPPLKLAINCYIDLLAQRRLQLLVLGWTVKGHTWNAMGMCFGKTLEFAVDWCNDRPTMPKWLVLFGKQYRHRDGGEHDPPLDNNSLCEIVLTTRCLIAWSSYYFFASSRSCKN